MASIFDNLWPTPDEYLGQNSAPQGWNGGYMDYRWGPEVDGGKPFNQFDISRRYNGMQGIDPRAMGESVLMANDPNMSPPPFQAPPIPAPQPPMLPFANQYAGRPGGQAMGYAPEEPQQQPFGGRPQSGPPGPQYAQAGPPPGAPSIGDRLGAGGKGFFNAGSAMEAIGNLIGGISTGQPQDARSQAIFMENASQAGRYQAVLQAGGSPAQANAAAASPEAFKAMVPELFSGWKIVTTGENPITGKQTMMQGPGGQLRPLSDFIRGRARGVADDGIGGGGGGDSGGPGGGGGGILARGVQQYNPNLSGEDYLKQFSPEVQAAVKAYIRGDVAPSGNPRLQGIAGVAKTIAQKYGQDMGIPVSDALFAERRKYRTELGSTSAVSAGGQTKAFTQGIDHAATLAQKLEGLQNWNGLGIPFLAAGANTIREALSTNQAGLAKEVKAIGQTLAGEVGKLFSGAQGGGVREREMTASRFNSVGSGPELAGALEGTIETMEGGLRALEARRDQILGPNNDVQLITKETEAKIAKIREVIARLKEGTASSGGDKKPAPISGFKVLKVQ